MQQKQIQTRVAAFLLLTGLLITVLGCSSGTQTGHDSTAATPGRIDDAASQVDSADNELSLSAIDAQSFEALLKQHRGKLVLVDFWATWCVPCVKGLPHTVELASKYAANELVVVTVAIEEESQTAAVQKTLEAVDAQSVTNLIVNSDATQAMDDFEINSGTLPTLRLYDREGSIITTFGDGDPEPINFEAIEVAIRNAL